MELYRNTYAEVDLKILQQNLKKIMDISGANGDMILCVKADAYGHGAVEVAKAALDTGVKGFAVELPEEGAELRENGIYSKIVVMGRANSKQMKLCVKYGLEQCVADCQDIYELHKLAQKFGRQPLVHIKIDTGMGRIGITDKTQLNSVLNLLKEYAKDEFKVILQGVFTHFARADEKNKDFTKKQLEDFKNYIKIINESGFQPEVHCSNSAAGISLPELKNTYIRCGIAAYGYHPSEEYTENKPDIKPVMKVFAEIAQIKDVPEDFAVGYNSTYYTKRKSKIATIQIGYADGFNRLLSNKGKVLVKGNDGAFFAPVIGRICMDQAMVDITDIHGVQKGDLVIVMGDYNKLRFDADDMAKICNTISYEILTSYSKRVPRVYLK